MADPQSAAEVIRGQEGEGFALQDDRQRGEQSKEAGRARNRHACRVLIVKIVKIVKTVAQCVTGRGHNGPAVPPSLSFAHCRRGRRGRMSRHRMAMARVNLTFLFST